MTLGDSRIRGSTNAPVGRVIGRRGVQDALGLARCRDHVCRNGGRIEDEPRGRIDAAGRCNRRGEGTELRSVRRPAHFVLIEGANASRMESDAPCRQPVPGQVSPGVCGQRDARAVRLLLLHTRQRTDVGEGLLVGFDRLDVVVQAAVDDGSLREAEKPASRQVQASRLIRERQRVGRARAGAVRGGEVADDPKSRAGTRAADRWLRNPWCKPRREWPARRKR